MRLLLVEDDPNLSRSLKSEMEIAGFAVDVAFDGESGEFLGMTESYDLVICSGQLFLDTKIGCCSAIFIS